MRQYKIVLKPAQQRNLLLGLGSQIKKTIQSRCGYQFTAGLAGQLVHIGVLTEAQCLHLWKVLNHHHCNQAWKLRTHGFHY